MQHPKIKQRLKVSKDEHFSDAFNVALVLARAVIHGADQVKIVSLH
jgi:hypothetical protein